jgi:hypothetical protein
MGKAGDALHVTPDFELLAQCHSASGPNGSRVGKMDLTGDDGR